MIIDAHLDLAYNALVNGRNLQQTVSAIRASQPRQSTAGIATVSLPDLKQAGVGIVFSTLFVEPASHAAASLNSSATYKTAEEAHRLAMAQFDYYHRLADADETMRLVTDAASLQAVVDSYQNDTGENGRLLGLVPLMEGADPIRQPEELEMWVERGLRVIGPAWDDTRYASGAWRGSRTGLTPDGNRLLEIMADFGLILDITHMSEKAALESLERYEGRLVATHANCRALVPGERQLSDTQIRLLGERNGVIGVVLYNRFLKAGQRRGDPKHSVTLDHVVAHIDHICQLLGNGRQVGIGSDFDGGFGAADIPAELDSVADISQIATALAQRGYEPDDIAHIMGDNWLRVLQDAAPAWS